MSRRAVDRKTEMLLDRRPAPAGPRYRPPAPEPVREPRPTPHDGGLWADHGRWRRVGHWWIYSRAELARLI